MPPGIPKELKPGTRFFMKLLFFTVICAAVLSVSPSFAAICENEYAALDADFEGARMSSCEATKKGFKIRIDPENKPINPSPWYAFRVTPKRPGDLKISMQYSDATHRYRPKRSGDGINWRLVAEKKVRQRRKGKRVTLRLKMEEEPFLIAGQELLLPAAYEKWTSDISARRGLDTDTIGKSVEGRALTALKSNPQSSLVKKEYVLFVGRQHPPELTGAFAMLPFLEVVFGDTPLATRFRDRFHIIAVPLMNPDGVVNGHWRHNMNGVDLNRDWGPFTQPETQAIEKILDRIAEGENSELRLMMDFHSTKRNVFYTQFKNVETIPPQFTSDWIAGGRARLPDFNFDRAERETSELATSKNYVNRRFGAPAITYELGDQTDRRMIRKSAVIFAEEMMETLLESDTSLDDIAASAQR